MVPKFEIQIQKEKEAKNFSKFGKEKKSKKEKRVRE